ncbi:glycosyltransferase family 2 protein [Candidatus Cerribacteria bacterium 'Amazon FNV 2010 28 9']|uniref:Glycosyltransferase family 2 protein n=1 Tax=Candidatus Cerribacteria bacterium 'Amazon FNV 2010 28 9' TaxID=2081795 RepID=A0A317JQ92_9BACT|nr:MAG: glycosyltransferase family 2 protein [Candidatus Cerribacteria bacterium 'Amazon FNV 2010 28 9']
MSSKKAIIIVPTYNEKENVVKLIPVLEEVFAGIHNWDMHVLFVDDSSPDGTADEVKKFAKKNKHVHVHINPQKRGLGAAYLSGMKEAFGELGADVVFEFDADFSHDPAKIPDFLNKIDQGFDMVIGSRYIKGGSIPSDWGFDRKVLSVIGNLFITFVFTDFRIHDWTSGYRAITKKVYEFVVDEMSDPKLSGYTFQAAFLRKAVRKGFKVAEVPFAFVDRKIGKSKLGSDNIKTTLQFVIGDRFEEIINSRIFKFGVVGGLGFVINTIGLFLFSRIAVVQSLAISLSHTTGLTIINAAGTASALGAECAIISNFILNNAWTFSDRKTTNVVQTASKFIQFNIASFGAVILQFIIVGAGTHFTGSGTISKLFWLVSATAIGMVLNFIIYSTFIWKKK